MELIQALMAQVERLGNTPLSRLLQEPGRLQHQAMRCGPLYANFTRQTWDAEACRALFALARRRGVDAAFKRMLDGEPVNLTEHRAALHTALRGDVSHAPAAREAFAMASATRAHLHAQVRAWRAAGLRDVVSLGVGGSDLGPRLVVDALGHEAEAPRVHFVSNLDAHALDRVLAQLNPATTGVVAISKSFTTAETLGNLQVVLEWAGKPGVARAMAVTANPEHAMAAGFAEDAILPMWDWVGGRYSLWSAVGFSAALAVGSQRFDDLLQGAADYDAHCAHSPLEHNPAVWHALSCIWNANARGLKSHAVVPYDERLRLLPAYLQQLVMESLGKTCSSSGEPLPHATVPVWWGSAGTDAQHSYFQALHQGSQAVPVDFIGVVKPDHAHAASHLQLLANLLAQAQALANGHSDADPHRRHPGGRPSNVLLLDALTPYALGMLLAFYEHSVHAQSVLWDINAFDQFGVELGKRLATDMAPALAGNAQTNDEVSAALIAEIRSR